MANSTDPSPQSYFGITEDGRKTIFVVGLGMVGIAFIEKVLNLDEAGQYRIVTCGEETHLAYNRVALTEYFQHRNIEKLYLNSPEWYAQQDPSRFQFFVGETVTSIDSELHVVSTDKGRKISYTYCVIATGSDAAVPSYADQTVQGVFVYRNISDLNNLLAYAEKEVVEGGKAVVVGGGLLGLEAAKAVYDLETVSKVTIFNRRDYPLPRQLDQFGGEIVLRRIEAMGVDFVPHASVNRLTTIPNADDSGNVLTGLEMLDGSIFPANIVVFAIGITPRDDLARSSGIKCEDSPRHGIVVDDFLRTSVQDIFAIGECASWKGNTYGLIAPGIEMADILSFNLTQTMDGKFKERQMNPPDLSTKLKLMGVDVASFGDFFAERRYLASKGLRRVLPTSPVPLTSESKSEPLVRLPARTQSPTKPKVWSTDQPVSDVPQTPSKPTRDASSPRKRHGHGGAVVAVEGPVETLTYRDPFAGVYKKYIFSSDGKYLLGGMMVGDTSDFVKLVSLVKKKKPLDVPPSQFILGSKTEGEDSGADLDDDTQICSCHNLSKGNIIECIKNGITELDGVKKKTKAGTGCGGCMPLVTNIFKAEMKKAGHALSNSLCPHFAMPRADLFSIIKIKQLKTFPEIMTAVGVQKDSIGCEICKPAVGSILSSLYNEHVMQPIHHSNQDTNDRFMANIQRNGTFSVVPRIAAGEITPDKLMVLGQVAKKYGLYTKITGAQRVDLFGAQKADLPSIWKELVDAGFESGHAYGKALRTVKSCVGTSWCRYGVGDSVGLAIQLEERYKGIRSPHKLKGGVSGCVRECAEAQSKDFGLIATDKGWNLFVCGNGGASPRHATLLAKDAPPSKVIRIVDRFLMYYIRTADKLMRTARWLESMDGGIEKLKKVLLEDSLGICSDLEREMDELVGTYYDEWKSILGDPERQKQFRQFVNTGERKLPVESIVERGQSRPASWAKSSPTVHFRLSDIQTPKADWQWQQLAKVSDLSPNDVSTTSAAVRYGDSQLAIFHVPHRGYYATQQMCPHKRAFVLEHGLVGDDPKSGEVYISCPMHKRNFTLTTGTCLNDDSYSILTFEVKTERDNILVLLPESGDLDAMIGTSKWMVRKATAEVLDRGGDIEIVGPQSGIPQSQADLLEFGGGVQSCGDKSLEW